MKSQVLHTVLCNISGKAAGHIWKAWGRLAGPEIEMKNFTQTALARLIALPKSDQFQFSPAASPEILHHTVWRTWLSIAHSDERWLYYQFSLVHLYVPLQKVGRIYVLSCTWFLRNTRAGVLITRPRCNYCILTSYGDCCANFLDRPWVCQRDPPDLRLSRPGSSIGVVRRYQATKRRLRGAPKRSVQVVTHTRECTERSVRVAGRSPLAIARIGALCAGPTG